MAGGDGETRSCIMTRPGLRLLTSESIRCYRLLRSYLIIASLTRLRTSLYLPCSPAEPQLQPPPVPYAPRTRSHAPPDFVMRSLLRRELPASGLRSFELKTKQVTIILTIVGTDC